MAINRHKASLPSKATLSSRCVSADAFGSKILCTILAPWRNTFNGKVTTLPEFVVSFPAPPPSQNRIW